MLTPKVLADDPDREEMIPRVLPWLHDAGNPYFDWFFGTAETTRLILRRWMVRETSEVSLARTTTLLEGDEVVGGFVSLSGDELLAARKTDTFAILRDSPPEEKANIIQRMGLLRGYFRSPEPDEFYLSKMGLLETARGRLLGSQVLEAFLAAGKTRGFSKFRLDVSDTNQPARHLYDSAGFTVDTEATSPDVNMVYLSMTLG